MIEEDQNREPHIPVIQQLSIALGILVLIFGTTYIGNIASFFDTSEIDKTQADLSTKVTKIITESNKEDFFEDIKIEAESAYIWDIRMQKAIYNKNADERLPLASITKLMTALVAYELIDDTDTIGITMDAISQEGDSGFLDGEEFSLRNLTNLTLITSSNDGAYALASAAGNSLGYTENPARIFIDAMNIRAEEIGLSQTYFNNPTGLDISETKAGAYGSARDMAFLMEYVITNYPEVLELTKEGLTAIPNMEGNAHTAQNTNNTVTSINGLIASKTGYTDLAGGNLVIVYDAGLNRPIIVSVLGSTMNGRFSDVSILAEKARQYILSQ